MLFNYEVFSIVFRVLDLLRNILLLLFNYFSPNEKLLANRFKAKY